MEVKKEKIYGTDQLDVMRLRYGDKDKVAIFYKVAKVVVLPYTRNAQDVVEQIGIIKEFLPTRRNNRDESLITETEKDEDDNSLDTAVRGLEEESGYKVIDESRWIYLGKLYTSKISDLCFVCYAVDVTNIEKMERKPDGEVEEMSTFVLTPLSQITSSNDCLILSLVMKLFVNKYGKTFAINSQTSNVNI